MYKRICILSVICCSFCVNIAFGQAQIGITLGTGVLNKTNYPVHYDAGLGQSFAAGIYYQRHIRNSSSLHIEGLLEHRVLDLGTFDFIDSFGNIIGTEGYKIAFDYVTLPILFRTTADTKLKPFAETGPYLGYWLRTTGHTWYADRPDANHELQMKDIIRPELGIAIGAGMSFSLNQKLLLSLALRGNIGLTNTVKNPARGNPIRNEELYFLPSLVYTL